MSHVPCRTKKLVLSLAALLLVPAMVCHSSGRPPADRPATSAANLALVWGDDFNGPRDSAPDPHKWQVVTNDSGYGNRELEYYTPRKINVHEGDGHLVITARRESFTGPDGQTRGYTSARLESRGLFDVQYGRIEARIKLPAGKGLWPAFWLLGNDYGTIGWPGCGEIDIMENVGFEPFTVHGSLHGPGYSGANPLSGTYSLPGEAHFSDGYHVFAIEWEPREIRFYVDGALYETQKASSLPPGKHWVFDHPFYIVLNLAVGGYWPGDPEAGTRFPAAMLVDYVHVYRLKSPARTR